MAEADEGAFDQILAEEGRGEGAGPTEEGVRAEEVGDVAGAGEEEELLPEVESEGDAAKVAEGCGVEEAAGRGRGVERGRHDEQRTERDEQAWLTREWCSVTAVEMAGAMSFEVTGRIVPA